MKKNCRTESFIDQNRFKVFMKYPISRDIFTTHYYFKTICNNFVKLAHFYKSFTRNCEHLYSEEIRETKNEPF